MSPDDLSVFYNETIVALVRGLALLMGAFVAARLGLILRRRERPDGLVRGLGYGLVYIAVAAGIIEAVFAAMGDASTRAVAAAAAIVFVAATAAAGGGVWWLWRRYDGA